MTRHQSRALLAFGGALLTLALTVTPAQAKDDAASTPNDSATAAQLADESGVGPTAAPSDKANSTQGLSSTPTSRDARKGVQVAAATVTYSPAGCYGQTDYPHNAYPYASVHGRTRCAFAVARVTASATLSRLRWYGWQTLLTGNFAAKNNNNYSGDSTPHWTCDMGTTYDYKGTTTHSSLEAGTTYSTVTSNTARFSCVLPL